MHRPLWLANCLLMAVAAYAASVHSNGPALWWLLFATLALLFNLSLLSRSPKDTGTTAPDIYVPDEQSLGFSFDNGLPPWVRVGDNIVMVIGDRQHVMACPENSDPFVIAETLARHVRRTATTF